MHLPLSLGTTGTDEPPGISLARVQARLAQQDDMLRDRLSRLYGQTPGFEAWFERLRAQVIALAVQRPAALQQLDSARCARPDWHLSGDMLAYTAYVDRFAGTLRGVHQRIALLRELGVTYLHLLPFLRARAGANDGGFAVASFEEVEPRLGTMDDLAALAGALRDAGISLCSDFVLNHVADDHPWALAARRGDPRYRAFFHVFADAREVARFEPHLTQVFPQTAPGNFTRVDDLDAQVWTTFYPYQWDLNYANPEVFEAVALALLRLANQGVECFRLDSTAYLWKRAGTRCMNEPEAHWILQALRCLVDVAAPAVLLKAEAIVPTADLPPYFGLPQVPGRECHVAYHSSLMSAAWLALAEQRTTVLREVIRGTPPLPPGCSWLTYVRCHDDIGWSVLRPDLLAAGDDPQTRLLAASRFYAGQTPGSYADGRSFQAHTEGGVHGTNGMAAALVGLGRADTPEAEDAAVRRLHLLYALAMAFGGIPLVYMGDEVGLGNADAQTLQAGVDGRDLHRPWFDPQAWSRRLQPGTREHRVFEGLRALIALRRSRPELAADAPVRVLDAPDEAVLALQRGTQFLALGNFSGRAAALDLAALTGRPAHAWEALTPATLDGVGVQLPPWGLACLAVRT